MGVTWGLSIGLEECMHSVLVTPQQECRSFHCWMSDMTSDHPCPPPPLRRQQKCIYSLTELPQQTDKLVL